MDLRVWQRTPHCLSVLADCGLAELEKQKVKRYQEEEKRTRDGYRYDDKQVDVEESVN